MLTHKLYILELESLYKLIEYMYWSVIFMISIYLYSIDQIYIVVYVCVFVINEEARTWVSWKE